MSDDDAPAAPATTEITSDTTPLTLTIGPAAPERTWQLDGTDMTAPLITFQSYQTVATRRDVEAAANDVARKYALMRGLDPQVVVDTMVVVDVVVPVPTRQRGQGHGGIRLLATALGTNNVGEARGYIRLSATITLA
jgi:hypothetical protein